MGAIFSAGTFGVGDGTGLSIAGFAWAALMFALGLGVIAVASTGDLKLWAFYISVVAIGAKVLAFAVQYLAFRILVTNRLRVIGA